jgi:peroxiredoxin
MHCRDWLAQLEQHKDEILAAGLRLAAVGIGEPKHARRYCGQYGPSVECLANKTKQAYTAYGLRRGGLLELVGPEVILASAQTVARGIVQGDATGDPTMLGGVFIIDRQGVIRYARYDRYAGDHPGFAEILRAARRLPVH